jgi:glycosyltransferase involved in cell wall biosynthesis
MPKFSVVVPAYNNERHLAAALQSLVVQTEQSWEGLLVDDGSTDGTLEVMWEFASRDPRFRVLTQPNAGRPSVVRNRALAIATGAAVAFLDADDLYHPRKLEAQAAVLAACPDVDLVFSDMRLIDEDGEPIAAPHGAPTTYLSPARFTERVRLHVERTQGACYVLRPTFYHFMTVAFPAVSTLTVAFRRTLLGSEPFAFDESMTVGEDVDLWLRLARRGRVAYVDEVLSYYRQRKDSLTHDPEKYARGAIASRVKNLSRARQDLSPADIRGCRSAIAALYFDLGYHCRSKGRLRDAVKAYCQSFRYKASLKPAVALAKATVATGLRALRAVCRKAR